MSPDHGANGHRSDKTGPSQPVVSLRTSLDQLMTSETGLGFIYSALALLSSRYRLTDAVIVLGRQDVGVQVFRLGGRAVSTDFVAQLGALPGLYCVPPVVAAEDVELVMSMCQQALARHQVRFQEAQVSSSPFNRPGHTVGVRQARVGTDASEEPREGAESKNLLRALLSFFRARDARATISQLLVAVDVVTLALTLVDIHGPIRFVAGLILGLVIPGWSVVGRIRLNNAALEVSLTMATSLALVMVAAQTLITIRFWHPDVLEIVTCLVCLPSLLRQAGYRPHRQAHAK